MKIRYAAYSIISISLLFMGWQAHRTYLYVQAVHEKARTCDEIDCLAVKDAAKVMLANGLPAVK